jgi:hypothetical protein
MIRLLIAIAAMPVVPNFEKAATIAPPKLVSAVCWVESKHKVKAFVKSDGKKRTPSYGVCMVKYETAQFLGFEGTPEQLMDPNTNIIYAAKYLAYQLKRYNNNYDKALTAYNRGSVKPDTNLNNIYVQKVKLAIHEGR